MEQRFVETGQGRLAYEVHGEPTSEKAPLVLLPGFQSASSTWTKWGYLERLRDFHVLCLDPLGHGASTMSYDESAYSSARVVGHVEAVLDHADIATATVWGFSRGGLIAAMCGALIPDRCAHVVMGGAPLGDAGIPAMAGLTASEPLLAAADWDGYWQAFPVPLPDELKAHFTNTNDPQALAAAIRGMVRWSEEVPATRLAPTTVATFAYFGTGEVFADELRVGLTALGIDFHEGEWPGHAETMADAEGVVAVVREFLASSASR